jgi:uncharacterized protein YggE
MHLLTARRPILSSLFVIGLIPAAALGQITVTGDAQVKVRPDRVVLTLGVETRDPKLETAKSTHDKLTSAVIASAKAAGVPEEKIATDYVEIEPRFDVNGKPAELLEYVVRRTVVVTLEDIDRFEAILAGALEAGANYVLDVNFQTTELRKHRDKARSLAIVAAREKAEALAGALEQRIGRPTQINEQASNWWDYYGSGWGRRWDGYMAQNVVSGGMAGGDFDVGAFSPGEIAVSARVSVTFELQDAEPTKP